MNVYRLSKLVHLCDLCVSLRNQKIKAKNPDHPRRRIEIQFCMVGGLQLVVLSFKFDQNWLSGYRDVRGDNPYCITLANGSYSSVPPYKHKNQHYKK